MYVFAILSPFLKFGRKTDYFYMDTDLPIPGCFLFLFLQNPKPINEPI